MSEDLTPTGGPVFQLKVTLEGIRPPIWRTLQVRAGMTLAEFHDLLQVAFYWWDYHLHEFTAGGHEYGVEDPEWPRGVRDERAYTIGSILKKTKDTMMYEYDFGDGWRHKIVLEKIFEPDPTTKYPRCIKGKRSAPPEDCGGIGGYMNLLAVLGDPEHEEHAEYLEWVDDSFDPEAFSLEEINAALGVV